MDVEEFHLPSDYCVTDFGALASRLVALSSRSPRKTRNLLLRALFQFGQRAAGKAAKFGRGGFELLGVVSAACLECREPAAEAGELIRRQLGDGQRFLRLSCGEYSTAGSPVEPRKGIGPPPLRPVADWRASQRGEL